MKSVNKKSITEVQKVRFYVMDILYHHSNSSVMIPSSNQLASHFGIARSTVRLALEKMTKEGYLFTKRGTGTFTVPNSLNSEHTKLPLIGVRVGSGDPFYYEASYLNELGVLFQTMSMHSCNLRILHESADDINDFNQLLENSYFDALVAISVTNKFSEIAAAKMPVFSVGIPANGANNILYDGRQAADKLVKKCARKKSDITILSLDDSLDLENFHHHLETNKNVKLIRKSCILKIENEIEDLKQLIRNQTPDIIMCRKYKIEKIQNIIDELLVPASDYTLVRLDASDYSPFPSGLALRIDLNQTMEIVCENIMESIKNTDYQINDYIVDYDIL